MSRCCALLTVPFIVVTLLICTSSLRNVCLAFLWLPDADLAGNMQ